MPRIPLHLNQVRIEGEQGPGMEMFEEKAPNLKAK